MKAISQERFNAFYMLTRHPMAEVLAEELEWYADDEERVIATLFRDTTDDDYCYLLLARDETGKFRCIDVACSFPTLQLAWSEMKAALTRETAKDDPGHGQDDELAGRLDLFAPALARNAAEVGAGLSRPTVRQGGVRRGRHDRSAGGLKTRRGRDGRAAKSAAEVRAKLNDEIPNRFGGPLYSKLQKGVLAASRRLTVGPRHRDR